MGLGRREIVIGGNVRATFIRATRVGRGRIVSRLSLEGGCIDEVPSRSPVLETSGTHQAKHIF